MFILVQVEQQAPNEKNIYILLYYFFHLEWKTAPLYVYECIESDKKYLVTNKDGGEGEWGAMNFRIPQALTTFHESQHLFF